MSSLHPDSFHVTRVSRKKPYGTSTKKGMMRKTVSKRRAYVNTPYEIAKKLRRIQYILDKTAVDGQFPSKHITTVKMAISNLIFELTGDRRSLRKSALTGTRI